MSHVLNCQWVDVRSHTRRHSHETQQPCAKHKIPFLSNWILNKPCWLVKDLYEKYFLSTKKELQKTKLELDMLKLKVEQLELAAEMRSTMEKADNVTNLFEERSNK